MSAFKGLDLVLVNFEIILKVLDKLLHVAHSVNSTSSDLIKHVIGPLSRLLSHLAGGDWDSLKAFICNNW